MLKRIFAIGDIHGCIDKLENLLEKLPVDWTTDKLIFLGDYVDRGPDPKAVVQLLSELKAMHPYSTIFLKGNHESLFLDFLENGTITDAFLKFGGEKTIKSYQIDRESRKIPSKHLDFLINLKTYYILDDFCFVHAGLKPGISIEEQDEDDLLWIRYEFIRSDYDWGKRIIFGHTPFETPLIKPNKIGIDTGAVYGGRLTCLVLPDIDFIFA